MSNRFWQQHPALLYGLASLLGCFLALTNTKMLFLPIGLLYFPLLLHPRIRDPLCTRLLLSLLVGASTFFICFVSYQCPPLPREGVEGTAYMAISALQDKKTPFGQTLRMQGRILQFAPHDDVQRHLAVKNGDLQINLPWKEEGKRPRANQAYRVDGTLAQTGSGYQLKVKSHTSWEPVPGTWSLAEWRYEIKQQFGIMLQNQMNDPLVAAFLTGLAIGDFSDNQIATALGRFGLQHILAISGFHFAIVAALLSAALRCILSRHAGQVILLLLLFAYLLFLGPGASILRAWIMATVGLLGHLLYRSSNGLNSLGIALLVLLTIDPAASQSLAFQLSFLATAAILLFYAPAERLLRRIFPKRPLSQLVGMHGWDQHAVVILAFFRGALALGIAVNLAMLPVVLFYFQKFPWLSLVYNLFFPFLVSISMLLLLLALPLQPLLPWAAAFLHGLNATYTRWVLHLTLNVPTSFDFVWRVREIPSDWIIIYLSAMAVLGVAAWYWMQRQQEERNDFAFL